MAQEFTSNNESTAISHSKSIVSTFGCVVTVLFSIMILMGSAGFVILFGLPFSNYMGIGEWVETPCEIVSCEVVNNRRGRNSLEIEYQYDIQGEHFTSSQYHASENFSHSRSKLLKIANKLQAGTKTVCFVNPDDISQAVLNRDFEPAMLIGLVSLLFVFVGLLGLFFGRPLAQAFITTRLSKIQSQEWRTAASLAEKSANTQEDWQQDFGSSGLTELKSGSNPKAMLIFMLVFSLFWNGIVSIFVLQVITEWGQGNQPWFMTLFMIPFLLVGIGTAGGVIYMFLAMFNPKPTVIVSDATIILGDSFVMDWNFSGSISSIRKLQIQLVGTEWAQYRQGTNTVTDEKEFHCEDVFVTEQSAEMQAGKVEIVIPQQTMHSFNASNNKIKWMLKLKGDIPRWPDVNQKYEFTVLPIPLE